MSEIHLKVYSDRSELILAEGGVEEFSEGVMSTAAKERYKRIVAQLGNCYLKNQILFCRDNFTNIDFSRLTQEHRLILNKLVNSVTSEVGRALIGLSILQLCVKSIEPEQSIRLHKGSSSTRDFSWCEGVSMRSLDKQFITPVLREYELLTLNADGFMMTRSLAENYPYTKVYKANLRGAKLEWINLVEAIERNEIITAIALQYILSQLLNQATNFKKLAISAIAKLEECKKRELIDKSFVYNFVVRHIEISNYAARLMEISIHALMQAMQEQEVFSDLILKELSQMRSANKKHGNIADIELLNNRQIVEAWDAKYGKAYLRDEIEELSEKLEIHPAVQRAGFVTSVTPERVDELKARCEEIENQYGISIEILTFDTWVEEQFQRSLLTGATDEEKLATAWITAYVESLAQQRREIAPIDEPCYHWLLSLDNILSQNSSSN
ncbi:MAG: hypothetical protein N5P05_000894 [Chroococcopsis gigantea SAG 12.99]|jgi:hypothetical protein|nr:hypothetical protein [Chlorogloea purpurea SAG 13.99]MDV2999288.1 hypothetical protein [Chroococcopsis gigantea SAG 12.99]